MDGIGFHQKTQKKKRVRKQTLFCSKKHKPNDELYKAAKKEYCTSIHLHVCAYVLGRGMITHSKVEMKI